MPADLNTRMLFILPERLTGADFFASITTFTLNNWTPNASINSPWASGPVPPEYDPLEAGIKMNLRRLYIVVLSMGGYETIESMQRWSFVAVKMSLRSKDQFHVRKTYRKYLLYYEVYSRRVRRLFVARKREYRDPSEYSVQPLIEGQEDNDKEDFQVSCLSWSALESRVECEKRGVLDPMIVLRDYFSSSLAVQIYIKQQTYLQTLEVFGNQGEGPSAFFTPPQSVCPSAAVSLSDYSIHDSSHGDEDLTEEARACKDAILSANRYYIIQTQKNMPPRPLPSYSQADLAPFMYDDVKITPKRRGKDRVIYAPAPSKSMAKLGSSSARISVEAKSYSSADSQNDDEVDLGEYIDRNRIDHEIEMKSFQEELVTKYGMKPHIEKPVGIRTVEKRLNFEEYISAHGLDAPEVKRFFDDRLKLEGGFWQHELERMEALERRVRGEETTSDKGWDRVSSDGSASSSESSESSEDSSGVDSPSPLLPYYGKGPISLHEYAQRISENRNIPLKWDYPAPVEHIQENGDGVDLHESAVNHGIQYPRDSVPLWGVASTLSAVSTDGSQFGQRNFPATYGPRTAPTLPLEREANLHPMFSDQMSANGMRILDLTYGSRIDITNMNPRSPPPPYDHTEYTLYWLRQRALGNAGVLQDWEEDDQGDAQQSLTSEYLPSSASWRRETGDERLYNPALLQEDEGAWAEREPIDPYDPVDRAPIFSETGNSNPQAMQDHRSLEQSRGRRFTVPGERLVIDFHAEETEWMEEDDEVYQSEAYYSFFWEGRMGRE